MRSQHSEILDSSLAVLKITHTNLAGPLGPRNLPRGVPPAVLLIEPGLLQRVIRPWGPTGRQNALMEPPH